jgi:putative ATP-dependent endonuclease of OLD family
MKVQRIVIKNFRSIKDQVLNFPESGMLALIGANNAGKSNFLRAFDLVFGEFWTKEDKLEDYDFFGGNRSNTIYIEFNFDNGRKVIFDSSERWPEYLDARGGKIYGGFKEDYPCTYLSAERTLSKEVNFSKWSLMGKISKSFNSLMKAQSGLEEKLRNKFQEVQDLFDEVDQFNDFKDSFLSCFNEMQSDSPYKLNIDFKPFTPNNYFKTINILAEDSNINCGSLDLEELGDGAKNLVILSLLRSYATVFRSAASGILAIEEPEIYLHPQARRHLYRTLRDIASNSNIQIVYTTHDPAFLRLSGFDSIKRVSKDYDDEDSRYFTKLVDVSAKNVIDFADKTGFSKSLNSEDKVKQLYSLMSNQRLPEAFFSRLVILCEGPTEELAIPAYLEMAGLECDKIGVSVLGVSGKGEIPKYWRLFYLFEIPMIVVMDNDSSGSSSKQNNKIIADCFNCELSDIEEDVDVFKHLKLFNEDVFEQDIIVLEQDFEKALQNDAGKVGFDLSSIEAESLDFSNSKPVRAHFVASCIKKHSSTYVPSFITNLKDLIVSKLDQEVSNIGTVLGADELSEDFDSEITIDDLPF